MVLGGELVAAVLLPGCLPLFVGLVVVMPVLGHATWHLCRKPIVWLPVQRRTTPPASVLQAPAYPARSRVHSKNTGRGAAVSPPTTTMLNTGCDEAKHDCTCTWLYADPHLRSINPGPTA